MPQTGRARPSATVIYLRDASWMKKLVFIVIEHGTTIVQKVGFYSGIRLGIEME
jgi:hypothetical protein